MYTRGGRRRRPAPVSTTTTGTKERGGARDVAIRPSDRPPPVGRNNIRSNTRRMISGYLSNRVPTTRLSLTVIGARRRYRFRKSLPLVALERQFCVACVIALEGACCRDFQQVADDARYSTPLLTRRVSIRARGDCSLSGASYRYAAELVPVRSPAVDKTSASKMGVPRREGIVCYMYTRDSYVAAIRYRRRDTIRTGDVDVRTFACVSR